MNEACGRVTRRPAAVDLKAHADALLPGQGADADVTSQSLFGEEGAGLVCRVVVPLEDLKMTKYRRKKVTSSDIISTVYNYCCFYCYCLYYDCFYYHEYY